MKPSALAPLFVLCSLGVSAGALAEGSAEKGESKSTACIACHGPGGNSVNPEWPSLAGQGQEYIRKQLQAFKGGARKNPLMTPMATGLSDEDMADLGAYFAAQKPTGLEADPGKLAVGQRVYRAAMRRTVCRLALPVTARQAMAIRRLPTRRCAASTEPTSPRSCVRIAPALVRPIRAR